MDKDLFVTHRRIAFCLAAVLASASLIACAETRTQESTGQYVDDATITGKVKAALVQDQSLKGFEIKVQTYKNVVQLSGFVDSPQLKERAQQVAGSIGGVKSVRNDLIVK